MIAIIVDEKFHFHSRHLGNDVYSFTLKWKENVVNYMPLYVSCEAHYFWRAMKLALFECGCHLVD